MRWLTIASRRELEQVGVVSDQEGPQTVRVVRRDGVVRTARVRTFFDLVGEGLAKERDLLEDRR